MGCACYFNEQISWHPYHYLHYPSSFNLVFHSSPPNLCNLTTPYQLQSVYNIDGHEWRTGKDVKAVRLHLKSGSTYDPLKLTGMELLVLNSNTVYCTISFPYSIESTKCVKSFIK
jgi:hypothetical protein